MIPRAAALKALDQAIEQYAATIICGLPRVGRSSLLGEWVRSRSNAKFCHSAAEIQVEPGIFVLDHVELATVDAIISAIRSAEKNRALTRIVLLPNDLETSEALRTRISGISCSITIDPLGIAEVSAEPPVKSLPMGPADEVPEVSEPINSQVIDPDRHWLRGGLPESLNADTDTQSLGWRWNMLAGLLARDYTNWGVERSTFLENVLRWLANQNGSELDETKCPFAKRSELRSAVYVLERLDLVRRLPNYPARSSRSLGKNDKVYVRDTGVLHALLGIETSDQLHRHPKIGESFESYAIESLIHAADGRCGYQFYREKGDQGENEIDLILDFPSQNDRLIAIEFKVGQQQKAKKGFHIGCTALGVKDEDRFVVHAGGRPELDQPIPRLDIVTAVDRIRNISRRS